MDYVKLGKTGLEVSRLCLGGMTFGAPDRGLHTWTLDDEKTRPIVKRALELGINFFDTANVYSDGTSEEILGRALKEFARRDEVVIATKVSARVRPGPNGQGLSRAAIIGDRARGGGCEGEGRSPCAGRACLGAAEAGGDCPDHWRFKIRPLR
jgi:aryl-alcohol dehydrogenase-like predicted oxidoreductase